MHRRINKAHTMATETGYFCAEDVAEYLGIKVNTVRKWVSQGKIPHYKMPGSKSVRFRKEEIDDWMHQGFRSATKD